MAGRLQLAITGIQDQWLTGEPEFSYFLMNFKRHTKFAIEAIESPFDGNADFDEIIECRIPQNKGDLIRSMMLKFTLPQPTGTVSGGYNDIRYRESIGAQIIEYADLLIGGQTIERITGDYIYMYNQIHNNKDDIDQTLYFLMGHGNYISVSYDWDYSVFLPFYFFRHPSLAIPICALTKQLVEIRIKFRKLEDVTIQYKTATDIIDPPSDIVSSIKKVSLVTDFFFITDDEKNFLLTRPIEYVITQLQMSQFRFNAGVSKKSGMLNFKNPVKEMFFVAVSDDVHKYEPIKQVTMKFNNNTIIDADNLMVSYEQPLKYYTGVTDNKFGVYSFSMTPETYYPTGQVNMSRIAHNLIEVELESPDANYEHKVYVYAVNYNVLHIQSGLGGLKF